MGEVILLHKDLKKNVIFSLIALLAFGYQFSVLPFSNVEYNTVRAAEIGFTAPEGYAKLPTE